MSNDVRLLEPLNTSLWTSTTRVLAAHRMWAYGSAQAAAANPHTVPEDVARVLDQLMDRERITAGKFVRYLNALDEEVTDRYRHAGGQIPAGGSAFEPAYRHYLELDAAPTASEMLEAGYVWTGMPPEMYLINRISNPTALDSEMLQRAGYTAAYARGDAGESVVEFSAAKVSKAEEIRRILSEFPLRVPEGQTLPKPMKANEQPIAFVSKDGGMTVLVVSIVGLCALIGVGMIFVLPKMLNARSIDAVTDAEVIHNERVFEWNDRAVETNSKIIDFCVQHAAAMGESPDHCAEMSESLIPFMRPQAPGTAASQLAGLIGCDFGGCWRYTTAGAVIGLLAGYVAAERMS